MWFKVVFNKDGSVSSCEGVEGLVREDGRGVVYVDAPSKTLAIKQARSTWDRLRMLSRPKRAQWRSDGRCHECGGQPEAGKNRCAKCIQYRIARKARGPLTEEQRKDVFRANLKRAQEAAWLKRTGQRKPLEELCAVGKTYARFALEKARDEYWRLRDTAFAEWLDERIVALGGKARPKAAE